MRADAERNRALIGAAALRLFSRHGADVSMERIAREAGVAVGTLYRHFPDRNALVHAIAACTLRDLLAHAREAVGRDEPRRRTLIEIVKYCTHLPLALVATLTATPVADPEVVELQREVDALLEQVIGQAQEEGDLRRDLTATEILTLVKVMVCRADARPDDPLTVVILAGLAP
ncbi:TetR/AcrR family transcriptional regulator [Embleya sp. NPDC059237]|uniref:TetR/AcrR family transcriptional regulator n=1 Tax=Embleya sp. NPDC059237 TaxID=3346784 RepID=UPI0036BFAB65